MTLEQPARTQPWMLTAEERATLERALDALLPPAGTFPAPSATGIIDHFVLRRIPAAGGARVPYPGLDADRLRAILHGLTGHNMTTALQRLEVEQPRAFTALWQLAVFGYYSRPEVIAAVARDHAPAYHGAPLPLGYNHAIAPWDPDDPLQLPRNPRGSWTPTDAVRRVDLSRLPELGGQE